MSKVFKSFAQLKTVSSLMVGLVLTLATGLAAHAEDIEIYNSRLATQGNTEVTYNPDVYPNVLFILDNSESMAEKIDGKVKLTIIQDALRRVIEGDPNNHENNGFENINLGLMRFNNNSFDNIRSGGTVIDAVAPALRPTPNPFDNSSRINRDEFIAKVNSIKFEAGTPLAETMYEAYRYFAGLSPYSSEAFSVIPGQMTLDRYSVVDRNVDFGVRDETFDSPINTDNQCQGNYVVLLSDGEASADTDYDAVINQIPNIEFCDDEEGPSGAISIGDNCTDEIAGALKNNLGVNTFTIGFDRDIDLLKEAALKGSPLVNPELGDGYFLANNITELEAAFAQILNTIELIESESFVAPAVTVNAFNRLQNRSDIYFVVFEPQAHPRWLGNLKKYRIGSGATIIDANGNNAISSITGYFDENAKSYWSDSIDGEIVTEGGFAAELGVPRKLYANLDADSNRILSFVSSNINSVVHKFSQEVLALDETGKIIGTILSGFEKPLTNGNGDLPVPQNMENIVRWTFGQDVDQERGSDANGANKYAGDSLHSTPLVLSFGNSDEAPKDVIFMTSNQGLLHAITANDASETGGSAGDVGGSERWAYLPDPSLLENLGAYYNRQLDGSTDHKYGLDGEITGEVVRNAQGFIDTAHLFFGQRRGGRKYFAVDVSNAHDTDDPVAKLWTITGGEGDFERLGQTWARPIHTHFKVCANGTCDNRPVVVLNGGYDTDYDDPTRSIASLDDDGNGQNTLGNVIYVVDAANGELLWMASNTSARIKNQNRDLVIADMDHSIPSSPTVLDVDKDGALDVIFAVDISGQVFRFDFKQNSDGTAVEYSGGMIANLQDPNSDRRFFNPLGAVLLPSTNDGAKPRIALVSGTGYRAHPLTAENNSNRFYVLYDANIEGPQELENGNTDYRYVGDEPSLSIIDSDILVELEAGDALLPGSTHEHGYYIELENSTTEKIMNPTVIADFQAIGVSYTPSEDSPSACEAGVGTSKAYRLDLLTGETKTRSLKKKGLSAPPTLAYVIETDASGKEQLKPLVIIGAEIAAGSEFGLKPLELGKARKRAWWEIDRGPNN